MAKPEPDPSPARALPEPVAALAGPKLSHQILINQRDNFVQLTVSLLTMCLSHCVIQLSVFNFFSVETFQTAKTLSLSSQIQVKVNFFDKYKDATPPVKNLTKLILLPCKMSCLRSVRVA